jgi:DNA-damage-inducible protein J
MNQVATIHARIDEKTKAESESVLRKIGMTPTEAVRLLYRQIALRKEFPLELRVPNRLTAQTLDSSDRGEEIESFDSLDSMVASWKQQ